MSKKNFNIAISYGSGPDLSLPPRIEGDRGDCRYLIVGVSMSTGRRRATKATRATRATRVSKFRLSFIPVLLGKIDKIEKGIIPFTK